MRILWLMAGLFFTALGIIGAFLPVMPTTVFLLAATACFARSSPRLHGWLVNHPVFGPPIRNWHENGAISRKAKWLAVGTMAVVFGLSLMLGLSWKVLLPQALLIGIGAAFILTRPDGPST
jgi:uncharacterized protein